MTVPPRGTVPRRRLQKPTVRRWTVASIARQLDKTNYSPHLRVKLSGNVIRAPVPAGSRRRHPRPEVVSLGAPAGAALASLARRAGRHRHHLTSGRHPVNESNHPSPTASGATTCLPGAGATPPRERLPAEVLDDDEPRPLLRRRAQATGRLFYRLLCYGALAAQPAPEAVVDADWRRLRSGRPARRHARPATSTSRATPSTRPCRAATARARSSTSCASTETRDIWSRLLPRPADPDVAVDVLHACLGRRPQVARLLGGPRDAPLRPVARRRRSTASPACPTAACASAPCAWASSTCPKRPTRSPT